MSLPLQLLPCGTVVVDVLLVSRHSQKSCANELVMNDREGITRRGPHAVLAMWAGWPTVDVP